MPGEQRQHMVKKRQAGFDPGFSFAIKIESEGNFGFQRMAFDLGLAHLHQGIKPNPQLRLKLEFSTAGISSRRVIPAAILKATQIRHEIRQFKPRFLRKKNILRD
jgi:hypothetical protein